MQQLCRQQFRHAASTKKGRHHAQVFCMAVTNSVTMLPALFYLTRFPYANRYPPPDQVRGLASLENALPIEKFNQFGNHLVRRFFHQPMSAVFDQDPLDICRDHLALLDQERAAGFLA